METMEKERTAQVQKIKPDFVSSFTAEFDREIMISDRKRAFFICGLSLFAVLWFNIIGLFFSEEFPVIALNTFHNKNMYAWLTIVFAGLAGYESIYALGLTLFLKRKKTYPIIPRLVNALIEISIPTIMIYFSFMLFASVQSLVTPIIFLYFIFISLSALRLMFTISLMTGIVAGAQYFWISLYVIHHSAYSTEYSIFYNLPMQITKSFLIAMVGIVTGIVSIQIRKGIGRSLRTIDEKNHLINIFGQHISPVVVDKLIQQKGDLGSETRFVGVMFLDIRNFTLFAESKAPEEVVNYLNSLFDFMIDLINKNGGIINKFLGDGFMAVFGAPLSEGADCRNAVAAAMQILARLQEEIAGGRIAETRVGIGIHAGMAVTGHVGSSQRKEYTIIGDVVNLASRIEQLNKAYNSQVLVSDVVWKDIEGSENIGQDMGLIDIHGHAGAVRLYKLA
jgi:adenylate cyclase